jgi:ELWxxDGT repeat protein
MLFGASDATGAGLWATDGTASGTVLLRRLSVFAQLVFPGSPNYIVMVKQQAIAPPRPCT